MVGIAVILALAVGAALYELPAIIRKGWIKEAVVYCIILCLGIVTSIITVKQIILPSPLEIVIAVYKPVLAVIRQFV